LESAAHGAAPEVLIFGKENRGTFALSFFFFAICSAARKLPT
jgi:hypothetical protein